jgi:phosphohistidine phosphatase
VVELLAERTLILLRHAKSDWPGDTADRDRPVAERGRRQAPKAGRWMARNVREIDLALVSPALRARETWELASAELPSAPPVRTDERVYAASADELLDVVRTLPEDAKTVVLIGHNPGIEELASLLTGAPVRMPTSAIAVLRLRGSWSAVKPSTAELRAEGRPPADR